MRRFRWLVVLLLCLMVAPIASAQSDQRCFTETGQCISGRIRQFWEQMAACLFLVFLSLISTKSC